MRNIPYGRQDVSEADIDAVVEVLRSEWLTQGPVVDRFEQVVAEYCGTPYSVAVNSATSALHLACRVLDLGPGDWLWTTPNTFVASANCALYCGAKVDFVDIDPRTYNLSVRALEHKLVEAQRSGCLPKIVVPVHFAGQPCDMPALHALSQQFGFRIIEDASHAIGARYLDSRMGDCRWSDIAVFSFHPVKIITTGEGGMLLTRDQVLYEKLKLLRSHGITRDAHRMIGATHGPWYYQQIDLGYNYRMTDIQSALGISQMSRLDTMLTRRRTLASQYDKLLSGLPLRLPWLHPNAVSAWHLYSVCLEPEVAGERRRILESLRSSGIGANVHYIPVHSQPYYQAMGFRLGDFPIAEEYYAGAISLPLYYGLSDADQAHVARTLRLLL